jgi:hypothetical protein
MRQKLVDKSCIGCSINFSPKRNARLYCTLQCAIDHRTTNNISKGFDHAKLVGAGTKFRYNSNPTSLYELSTRTISKILERLRVEQNIGCSNCGWKESISDIHHINGRKILNCHNHSNLCYLCPNCHRMAGKNLIDKSKLISLDKFIGDLWKQFYFG